MKHRLYSGMLAAALLAVAGTALPPAEPARVLPPRQDPKDRNEQLSKAAQKRARRALRGKR